MSLFHSQVGMTGEEVTILRESRSANWVEGRHMAPRGLDRDIYADEALGTYSEASRLPMPMTAVISSQSEGQNKQESGEVRTASLQGKFTEPVYATDDEKAEYADLIIARNETWKITSVRFDRWGGLWIASLAKLREE